MLYTCLHVVYCIWYSRAPEPRREAPPPREAATSASAGPDVGGSLQGRAEDGPRRHGTGTPGAQFPTRVRRRKGPGSRL